MDVNQIELRFEALSIQTDWQRFHKITRLRNDIEHYSTSLSRDAIRGMIADTFIIVRDFINQELAKDPKSELEGAAWDTLLSVSEVFEKERNECQQRLASIDWQSSDLESAMFEVACVECGSQLIIPSGTDRVDGIQCRSCDEGGNFESGAERALKDYLGSRNYLAMKDGGEEVLIMCPFCFQEGYVVDEGACAICGESCAHTCTFCANPIPTCELSDGSLCGYCDHMLNKDD